MEYHGAATHDESVFNTFYYYNYVKKEAFIVIVILDILCVSY